MPSGTCALTGSYINGLQLSQEGLHRVEEQKWAFLTRLDGGGRTRPRSARAFLESPRQAAGTNSLVVSPVMEGDYASPITDSSCNGETKATEDR